MAPAKWGLLLFFGGVFLLGLPIKAEPEGEVDGKKSVKECREHIEKALEQYWDGNEPAEGRNPATTQAATNEDDDDEDDDDDENSSHNNSNKGHDELKENDDDDDDDDEVEDDEDDDNDDGNPGKGEAGLNEDDDDDDDDDDYDDDDDDNDHQHVKEPEVTNSSSDRHKRNSEKTDSSEVTVVVDDDDDDDDDDEDDEDDDDDIANEESAISNGSSISSISDSQPKNKLFVDQRTKVEVKGIEITSADEDDEDENDEDDDEEEDPMDIVARVVRKYPAQIMKTTESVKVTGETHPASARMAQELPKTKPPLEQPKAAESEKKTLNVTKVQEEKKEHVKKIIRQTEPVKIADDDDDDDNDDEDDDDDDTIENIYDEEDADDGPSSGLSFRSRDHIDVILDLDEIGTEYDKEEEKLAQTIFRDIKKIQATNIKPIEMLYKYGDSTTRVLGDAEIFNKPMLLFLGPWSAGKTTIINYLLGIERTPAALKTGTGITDVDFSLITYGDQRQVVSGTELAADWRYAGVQKFGQRFLDHFRSISVPHTLLKKVIIVDTPGILENRKNTERGYSFNDAFQWFIDRADAIYVVLDPTKVDIGSELGSVLDQLKGRDARFILNKADTIRRSDLMRVVGQLFWNLSPLMSSTEAPVIYAVSLTTKPYHPAAPAKFLADQEKNFLYDMKDTLDKRVENRILYARRHAVRVRNHAKMVDCYLTTYYIHKSIFSNKKYVAKLITENPREYNIFEGLGGISNVSRYDLPDPVTYKDFFMRHPLYDFKPLASTCSYFRGCPMEKLDAAIANEIPELFSKYKKAKNTSQPPKQEGT